MITFPSEVKEVKVWASSSNDKVYKVVLITNDVMALDLAQFINEEAIMIKVEGIA